MKKYLIVLLALTLCLLCGCASLLDGAIEAPTEEESTVPETGETETDGEESSESETEPEESETPTEHVHEFGWITSTFPTCEAGGEETGFCVCGESSVRPLEALGHSENAEHISATDVAGGYTVFTCERCGARREGDRYTASEGLVYRFNADGETCALVGIGTCRDTYVYLPAEVNGYRLTEIAAEAFIGADRVVGVLVPESVTEIELGAFVECIRLVEACNRSTEPMIEEYVYDTLSESRLSTTEDGTFLYTDEESVFAVFYDGEETEVTLPSSVTRVAPYAFYNTAVTRVTIPASVTKIDVSAFGGCTALTEVVGGEGVTQIEAYAFFGCTSLARITLGKGLERIENCAFVDCAFTGIELPASLTYVGLNAFANCKRLTAMHFPEGVKELCAYVLEDCSALTSVTIPDGVTEIGTHAFFGCSSLEGVSIPSSVTSIGFDAFSESALRKVVIPGGVTTLETTFLRCKSLKEVVLSEGVSGLDGTFAECSALTDITLPSTLTFIGEDSFNQCVSLRQITIPARVETLDYRAFFMCMALEHVTFADDSLLTRIGKEAFGECKKLSALALPAHLSQIEAHAFASCVSLTEVVIPDKVTVLGESAFSSCDRLTFVKIGNGLRTINRGAFAHCLGLARVTLGEKVQTIHDDAFLLCEKLIEVCNGSAMTVLAGSPVNGGIAAYAKHVCASEEESRLSVTDSGCVLYTAGEDVVLHNYIGDADKLVIPEGVTSIGAWALWENLRMTELVLPASLKTMGVCAVRGAVVETLVIECPSVAIDANSFFCTVISHVYFAGDEDAWRSLKSLATELDVGEEVYYYSENAPTEDGHFWHYDAEGNPVAW